MTRLATALLLFLLTTLCAKRLHCPPGTHPVTDGGKVWLNRDTGKVEYHGKRRNWCRTDGPRRGE